MTKKKAHIPNPPRISLWRRDDGEECLALVEWDQDASNYFQGPDFPTVRDKAITRIKEDLDRISKGEDAKKARLMGRVIAKFEKAMA